MKLSTLTGAVCGAALLAGLAVTVVPGGIAVAQDPAAHDRGEAVYEKWCAPCHAPGPGHPGTQSLQVKYQGNLAAVLTERDDMTPAFVKTMVREGILLMAPFRKTEITDAELEDLAGYLTDK